jgi:hypothetical protein
MVTLATQRQKQRDASTMPDTSLHMLMAIGNPILSLSIPILPYIVILYHPPAARARGCLCLVKGSPAAVIQVLLALDG